MNHGVLPHSLRWAVVLLCPLLALTCEAREKTDVIVYNSSDSDPPDANASKSDYGIVTSIGYKF